MAEDRGDVRDVLTILDEHAKLKSENERLRGLAREHEEQARKVPQLESEIGHLQGRVSHVSRRFNDASAREGELEQKVRELESELRDRGELEREVAKAKEKANEYRERAEAAEFSAKNHAEWADKLEAQLESAEEEILHLKDVKQAALEDVRSRDALREHLGV